MKYLHMIAWVLVIIGGLNWLLVAFNWNLVDTIFGAGSTLSMIVYVLVGLAALWELFTQWKSAFGSASPAM